MTGQQEDNPFKIGDLVTFEPNERAVGWAWPSFERLKLKPGETGTVTRIDRGMYIYLDDYRGGFHWECFKKAETPGGTPGTPGRNTEDHR